MWAIPTGTSSAFKKKKSGKESQYMFSHPKTSSDSPIGLDRELWCDTLRKFGDTIYLEKNVEF